MIRIYCDMAINLLNRICVCTFYIFSDEESFAILQCTSRRPPTLGLYCDFNGNNCEIHDERKLVLFQN